VNSLPGKRGLYDPACEKDACGIGFVCNIKGIASREIVTDGAHILCRMSHRGGLGHEENTGDGAGILTALPQRFLERIAAETAISLPPFGKYGTGILFLPRNEAQRTHCKQVIATQIAAQDLCLLGWRPVPVNPEKATIGNTALASMPHIEQIFVAAGTDSSGFESKLYLARKHSTHILHDDPLITKHDLLHFCSLSTTTIVYKGMLTPRQLFAFYPDLEASDYHSHLAMVHSRFSTNTFPSWSRAQPNRLMCHNGEINTLLGNRNSMYTRQGSLESPIFGDRIGKLFPVIEADSSDSGSFDNVLELMTMAGMPQAEAMMIMVPEAWQKDQAMDVEKRAFYEYNAARMEPWDGPASIIYTDGRCIGAVLDRNGLRPSRYYLTTDDKCIMASEVGVLPIPPEQVIAKGRLRPGKMFLIDFEKGRMIADEEIKTTIAGLRPYRRWLARQRINLADIAPADAPDKLDPQSLPTRMRAFGYTRETMQFMLLPMVREKRDPLGSMGNDAALAVLSGQPRLLYDYFKQLFAQVTNPAIDSIREEVIMSLGCWIGPEGNLLAAREENVRRLWLPQPLLDQVELAKLKHVEQYGWRCHTLDITFDRHSGQAGFMAVLDSICTEARTAVEQGSTLLLLSDRRTDATRIPLPALIATGIVHHHLNRHHLRTRTSLLVETGEAREVHHHCLLMGFGADSINPYLAYEALWQAHRDGQFGDNPQVQSPADVIESYRRAVNKGLLKVMAKMGISTLQSYKGAQIFEAVGLADEVMSRCFCGTPSRLKGAGFAELYAETLQRHESGYPSGSGQRHLSLDNPGQFHWRPGGERHMWDPETVSSLQVASRNDDRAAYRRFAARVNAHEATRCSIRGLLDFRPGVAGSGPLPLSEVEPAAAIVTRFSTGAMSFGSISIESHETLAIAMNRIKGKSNTGEGGEDPERFVPLANGDSKRSAIKQVASGRFGVTIDYLSNADELQIKIVQGAKPGEGGELPGHKVDDTIARVRHSTPGIGLISPPPHHDIYSIEDLAQLIHDLKNANPEARISVKLGAEVGVGTVAAGVVKAKAEHLTIAGHDGGTGASPLTSIKHAGLPWELGIAETHQTLVMNNLRSRVVLQADGQLKTGRDLAIACLLGAEEFGFATAPLISLGCIMMRKCHLNTCPVGIATQDPVLRRKFSGQPEHVINYFFMVAEELREIMAKLGFATVNDMVGRVDMLDTSIPAEHWKAVHLDLTPILTPASRPAGCLGVHARHAQNHGLDQALDHQLIAAAEPALAIGRPVRIKRPIANTDRAVGSMLSHRIVKLCSSRMLPDDSIHVKLDGSAGQSLGAWLAKGITLEVEGDTNDYAGKGLSGGQLIVYPPKTARFVAEENILVGNVALYGATSGRAYFRGIAAERFAIRNSGAQAVVEGVGDHGCEYMTGGRVLVLGATGRNFAAGMSGGIAYIWDRQQDFSENCNTQTVELERLEDLEEIGQVHNMLRAHHRYTGSTVAAALLDRWPRCLVEFIRVIPEDYKQMLDDRQTSHRPRKAASPI